MQMQGSIQLQMMKTLSQSHGSNSSSAMPANLNFGYGYFMTPLPNISQNTVTFVGKVITIMETQTYLV